MTERFEENEYFLIAMFQKGSRQATIEEIPKIPYQLYICQPMFSPKSSIISL